MPCSLLSLIFPLDVLFCQDKAYVQCRRLNHHHHTKYSHDSDYCKGTASGGKQTNYRNCDNKCIRPVRFFRPKFPEPMRRHVEDKLYAENDNEEQIHRVEVFVHLRAFFDRIHLRFDNIA